MSVAGVGVVRRRTEGRRFGELGTEIQACVLLRASRVWDVVGGNIDKIVRVATRRLPVISHVPEIAHYVRDNGISPTDLVGRRR